MDGWTTSQVSATVAGGFLSGTATGTNSQLLLANFAGGPDLDLGFNDFIEISLQVPANYTNFIQISYGTTTYTVANAAGAFVTAATTGFSTNRVITIPAASIPKDGAFHTYRIDVGLEPSWRATLRDLRIDPLEGTDTIGMAFAIDYIRVGDEPGAVVYQPRYTTECPAAGGITVPTAIIGPGLPVKSMESKHFRFLWNAADETNSFWTANMPHGTLRNVEEVWQLYTKKLGYREPSHNIGTTNGTSYKFNVTSWDSGYWCGPDSESGTSLARLNITPDGLRVDPPTWVIPHELMHGFQFHNNLGYMPGEWYEFHANYGRERWLQHYQAFYTNSSGIDPTALRSAHLNIGSGRDYYLCWPFFLYIDQNPDGLPDLGEGMAVKLWQQTQSGEYPFMTLERLTPTSSIKDIVGGFARRGATYNYPSKTAIQATLATFSKPLDNAATARWQFTDLVQRSDDPTWWRVPYEMAPMQGAYAIHELVPTGSGDGRVVTVNLHGLPDAARGADWRASFIVIANDGTERYSTLWGDGTNSVTLAANENTVYLSVAGAPATFYYGGADESVYPYRSHPSKTRFPYELQVAGATPKVRDNGATTGLTQHSNGGGYRSVSVPASVYIGPNARVLGGTVSGNARIEDYAVVSAGTVTANAIVSGHAWVRGGTVAANAKVRDWALMEGGTLLGNARLIEHANIKGGAMVDNATAKGTSGSLSGTLAGNAIIEGDYGDYFSGRSLTNAIAFGHQPYVGVPDSFTHALPTGLYASYDFATAHDSRILDQYGVTDGFAQGNPTWYKSDGTRSGFLAFNGINQYVTLDRSVSDLRQITVAAWVKWSGGAANQPVWYLGAATNKCMYFTPDDGTGHAAFSIINGGALQTLAWTNPLPVGTWTHVAVTLDGVTAQLYVNGTAVASGSTTSRPDQFLAPNTATGLQQNYLACGASNSLPFFQGALDDVRFYATPLSAGDIAALQPPTNFTGPGTLYVDLRATNAASGLSTTFTTWTNFGAAAGNFTKTGTTTYSNSVASTGIPGVLFSGTSSFYSSANTSIADITGASDRTIEVWVYNPVLAVEETMVSLGDRAGTRRDCAFNFGNSTGWGAVTHFNDDMPWATLPSANAWHHLVYTYNGTNNVTVYVDGVVGTSKTLAGVLVTPTGDPINIGCQRATAAGGTAGQFFSGYINTVRIWGGAMTANQVAANYLFGPWTSPGSQALSFSAVSDVTLNAGVTLNITNSATDPNQPPLPLTFSIVSAPTNATINPVTGLFSWRPTIAQAGTTNLITLMVTNNGASGLAATQSFVVTVNPVSAPSMSNILLANGSFGFQIDGTVGPDYIIQAATNLVDWQTIFTTNPAALPFDWTNDFNPAEPVHFYRVQLGP